MSKRDRTMLMFIGWLIGIGTPFLIAGMTLQLTGSVVRIEVVRQ